MREWRGKEDSKMDGVEVDVDCCLGGGGRGWGWKVRVAMEKSVWRIEWKESGIGSMKWREEKR